MKSLVATFLTACLGIAIVPPAAAADLSRMDVVESQTGAFAGARLRVSLGRSGKARSSFNLTLAPTMRSRLADGRSALRFGEGVGLRMGAGGSHLRLVAAGRPLHAFTQRDTIETRPVAGISTLGAVAIGVGVTLVNGGIVFFDALNEASE